MPYKRILWGAVVLLVVAAMFAVRLIDTILFDVVFVVLMIIAALEINNLFAGKDKPTFKWAVLIYPAVVALLVIVARLTGLTLGQCLLFFVLLTSVIFIGFITIPYIFKTPALKVYRKYSTSMSFSTYVWEASKNSMLAFAYPTALLMFLMLINHFNEWGVVPDSPLIAEPNVALFGLLLVFVVSMFSDTTAYLMGTAIKSPKISMEKLGKGKSYSGVVGGILGGILGATLLYFVLTLFGDFKLMFSEYNFPFYLAMIAGFCGGVFNMLGDLASSFIKRRAEVKDFGKLIPGHGGIMDRLNGIAVNCVFMFVFLLVMFA